MPVTHIPNEVAMRTFMIATESVPGAFTTPTQRVLVLFTAQPGIGALRTGRDMTGGYDQTDTIKRETADASGTFGGDLTFQELAIFSQYAVKGGVTGTSDVETVPGYTYAFSPTFNADDVSTFSALFGTEGKPWYADGVRFDEFNISGDATSTDNTWQVSGTPFVTDAGRYEVGDAEFTATAGTTTTATDSTASWTVDEFQGAYIFKDYGTHIGEVRMVASNTATEITVADAFSEAVTAGDVFYISAQFPVLADPDFDSIPVVGTKIYLDAYDSGTSTLGTTDISERMLSFNVTQSLALSRKRRMPGVIGRTGRGGRLITGTLRFEDDRWDEYVKQINNTEVSLRIEQTGPVIDSTAGTNQLARIDIERAVLNIRTPDTDNTNETARYTFVAFRESPVWQITAKTTLATLP